MTDRIEPALSAEEWTTVSEGALLKYVDPPPVVVGDDAVCYFLNGRLHFATHERNAIAVVDEPVKLIALANAALPDSDPRKITRAWMADLRDAASEFRDNAAETLHSDVRRASTEAAERIGRYADALESYLPLEGP